MVSFIACRCSTAIRSSRQEAQLWGQEARLGVWYQILNAQGFIFFATAAQLYRVTKEHVLSLKAMPKAKRTKYIIINLTDVYGIDPAASTIFNKSNRLAKANGITIVWAGVCATVVHAGKRAGSFLNAQSKMFATLDLAQKWVEDQLLAHVDNLTQKWLVDKTCKDIYNRATVTEALVATTSNSDGLPPSQLLKWSARTFVPKNQVILTEGEADDALYLLYRGLINVTENTDQDAHTVYAGAYFNEHVLYSPPETGALYTATAAEDCVLLRISHEARLRMQHHVPHHSYELMRAVFKQRQQQAQKLHQMRSFSRINKTSGVATTPAAGLRISSSMLDMKMKAHIEGAYRSRKRLGLPLPKGASKEPLPSSGVSTTSAEEALQSPRLVDVRATTPAEAPPASPTAPFPNMNGNGSPRPRRKMPSAEGWAIVRGAQDDALRGIVLNALSASKETLPKLPPLAPVAPELSDDGTAYAESADSDVNGSRKHNPPPRITGADTTIMEIEFLQKGDFKVPLTSAQVDAYTLIFQLNDHNGKNRLEPAELSAFMNSVGHGMPVAELQRMMQELAVFVDVDGSIDLDGFLEFMRRTVVADLPISKMPAIHSIFVQSAKTTPLTEVPVITKERAPPGPLVTQAQAAELYRKLGFLLDDLSLHEIFMEVDADGDGCISEAEFVTSIGMLKRNLVEVYVLEQAFLRFRQANPNRVKEVTITVSASTGMGKIASGCLTKAIAEDDTNIYASDLVAALGVIEAEAEEMIFIADQKGNNVIDFTEFKSFISKSA